MRAISDDISNLANEVFMGNHLFSAFENSLSSFRTKKADVAEYFEVFDDVGLLLNEPPG